MRRLLLLGLTALVLTGCGGGSDGGYLSALDGICQDGAEFSRDLPQRMEDENLSVEEAQALATEEGERFLARIRTLDPPGSKQDAHDELVAVLDRGGEEGVDLDTLEEIADAYEGVGAEGCERSIRGSVEQVREASVTPTP